MAFSMQLRDPSMRNLPGRYQEYGGPVEADRPIFVHEDVPFRPELSLHCAFPTLPIDCNVPGPSEIWKEQERIREEAAFCAREEARFAALLYGSGSDNNAGSSSGNDLDSDTETCASSCCASRIQRTLDARLIFSVASTVQGQAERQATLKQAQRIWNDREADVLMESVETEAESSSANPQRPSHPHLRCFAKVLRRPTTPRLPTPGQLGAPLPPLGVLRQAYIVSLSKKGATRAELPKLPTPEVQVEEELFVAAGLDDEADQPSVKAPQRSPLNWQDLPDCIKYIIVYELTQIGLSFTRAVNLLSLDFEEIVHLIQLVATEKTKLSKYKEHVTKTPITADSSWLDDLTPTPQPRFITELISRKEIRRGIAFLTFMGLNDLATNLGYYQGMSTTAGSYEIPLNHFEDDGWKGLIPHFNVGCYEELFAMLMAAKRRGALQPRGMSAGEMLVRMDAPPGSVNPRHVDPAIRAYNPRTWGYNVPLEKLARGLHRSNFVLKPARDTNSHQEVSRFSLKTSGDYLAWAARRAATGRGSTPASEDGEAEVVRQEYLDGGASIAEEQWNDPEPEPSDLVMSPAPPHPVLQPNPVQASNSVQHQAPGNVEHRVARPSFVPTIQEETGVAGQNDIPGPIPSLGGQIELPKSSHEEKSSLTINPQELVRKCSPRVEELANRSIQKYKHLIDAFDEAERRSTAASPRRSNLAIEGEDHEDEDQVFVPEETDKEWRPKKSGSRKRPRPSETDSPTPRAPPVKRARTSAAAISVRSIQKSGIPGNTSGTAATPRRAVGGSSGSDGIKRPRGRPRKSGTPGHGMENQNIDAELGQTQSQMSSPAPRTSTIEQTDPRPAVQVAMSQSMDGSSQSAQPSSANAILSGPAAGGAARVDNKAAARPSMGEGENGVVQRSRPNNAPDMSAIGHIALHQQTGQLPSVPGRQTVMTQWQQNATVIIENAMRNDQPLDEFMSQHGAIFPWPAKKGSGGSRRLPVSSSQATLEAFQTTPQAQQTTSRAQLGASQAPQATSQNQQGHAPNTQARFAPINPNPQSHHIQLSEVAQQNQQAVSEPPVAGGSVTAATTSRGQKRAAETEDGSVRKKRKYVRRAPLKAERLAAEAAARAAEAAAATAQSHSPGGGTTAAQGLQPDTLVLRATVEEQEIKAGKSSIEVVLPRHTTVVPELPQHQPRPHDSATEQRQAPVSEPAQLPVNERGRTPDSEPPRAPVTRGKPSLAEILRDEEMRERHLSPSLNDGGIREGEAQDETEASVDEAHRPVTPRSWKAKDPYQYSGSA